MCESVDKKFPLMKPTFFSENDKNNPKNKKTPPKDGVKEKEEKTNKD